MALATQDDTRGGTPGAGGALPLHPKSERGQPLEKEKGLRPAPRKRAAQKEASSRSAG